MMQSAEKTGLEPVRRHIPVNGSFRNYCLTILGLLLRVSFEFFGSRTVTIIDFPFHASVLVSADYRATGRNRTRCLRITEAMLCHMSCCGKCSSFRAAICSIDMSNFDSCGRRGSDSQPPAWRAGILIS